MRYGNTVTMSRTGTAFMVSIADNGYIPAEGIVVYLGHRSGSNKANVGPCLKQSRGRAMV